MARTRRLLSPLLCRPPVPPMPRGRSSLRLSRNVQRCQTTPPRHHPRNERSPHPLTRSLGDCVSNVEWPSLKFTLLTGAAKFRASVKDVLAHHACHGESPILYETMPSPQVHPPKAPTMRPSRNYSQVGPPGGDRPRRLARWPRAITFGMGAW